MAEELKRFKAASQTTMLQANLYLHFHWTFPTTWRDSSIQTFKLKLVLIKTSREAKSFQVRPNVFKGSQVVAKHKEVIIMI